MLYFDDGFTIDTGGGLRVIRRSDGYYVVGDGVLIPVDGMMDGLNLIDDMKNSDRHEQMKDESDLRAG